MTDTSAVAAALHGLVDQGAIPQSVADAHLAFLGDLKAMLAGDDEARARLSQQAREAKGAPD